MTKVDTKKFLNTIIPTVLEAGEEAVKGQNGIVNIGKEAVRQDWEDDRAYQMRNAKTEMDVRVQEMLLQKIGKEFGVEKVSVDAEEVSQTKEIFPNTAPTVVVIDPIDGTLEYTQGSDDYSVNVGVINDGKVLANIIYFAKKKVMYLLDENKYAYRLFIGGSLNVKRKEKIRDLKREKTNILYINRRVPGIAKMRLKKDGFHIVEDDGYILWPEAFIRCMEGEYDACVMYDAQVRDVLLGAFIENFPEGGLYDWKGNKMPWPNGGRFETGIFARGNLDPKISQALSTNH